ncbi:MAG: helix-turn-helix transcriptional regulator [Spirochaetales bacterium]|nr:helix-turn-helix transcriptional regulator [Spirochaetales bacterium]
MIKRKKTKIFIIIVLLLPLFLILPLVLVSIEKPDRFYPGGKGFEKAVWIYNDPGKSKINDFIVKENSINLEFVHEKPGSFVGIGMNVSEYPDFYDFSPFSHISIFLITQNVETCTITLKLFVPGITDMNNSSSFRHLGYNFPVRNDQSEYKLPFSGFRDPLWWIMDFNPGRIDIGTETLKNGCFLLIESNLKEGSPGILSHESDPSSTINQPGTMTINSITLYRSHLRVYILLGITGGVYYVLIFVVFLINKRRFKLIDKDPDKMIEYKKLMVESYRDIDLKKVVTYLQTQYTDPEISLGKMGDDLGLSPARISALIKDEFELTFKQMLNKIRLMEAKRLLSETDRQIIDIAFSIGYNDRSYFYKVFLKNEGMSPSDFRKNTM